MAKPDAACGRHVQGKRMLLLKLESFRVAFQEYIVVLVNKKCYAKGNTYKYIHYTCFVAMLTRLVDTLTRLVNIWTRLGDALTRLVNILIRLVDVLTRLVYNVDTTC